MQCKIILFTAFFVSLVIALLPLFQRLGNSFSSFDGIGAPSPGALPCLKAGRVMPVSSAAADSLKLASGRTSVNLGGSRTGPVKWLLALNACPAKMAGEPFLRSDEAVIFPMPMQLRRLACCAALCGAILIRPMPRKPYWAHSPFMSRPALRSLSAWRGHRAVWGRLMHGMKLWLKLQQSLKPLNAKNAIPR